MEVLFSTKRLLGNLRPVKSGKVRDVYDLGDYLLIIATDRISTYDVIHPTPIPDKGKILTQLTLFWLSFLETAFPHHLITADVREYPKILRPYRKILKGRSMLVKKAKVIPVECVVRGYLYGSGWKEYQETQTVGGIPLKPRLKQADKLKKPLFTPATKALSGHDENITMSQVIEMVGLQTALKIQERSLWLYREAAKYAEKCDIIIADTKFEFGFEENGQIILIDEILTPDSSRFWPKESWEPGKNQPSFDKQPVRDYVDSIGWDHKPPAPELPKEVVERTQQRYLEVLRRFSLPTSLKRLVGFFLDFKLLLY